MGKFSPGAHLGHLCGVGPFLSRPCYPKVFGSWKPSVLPLPFFLLRYPFHTQNTSCLPLKSDEIYYLIKHEIVNSFKIYYCTIKRGTIKNFIEGWTKKYPPMMKEFSYQLKVAKHVLIKHKRAHALIKRLKKKKKRN